MKSNTGKYLKGMVIVWSCCLVVYLIIFLLVLLPQSKLRTSKENDYRKIKSNADEAFLASQVQTKSRLNEHIEKLNETLGDFVISPGSISNLTYEISGLSNEIGLNAFQVAPTGQSLAALDDCKYVSGQLYQVSFTSSFNKFATFVNALERYKPFIFVDTFSITKSRFDDLNHDVKMQLAILVEKDEKTDKGKG